MKKSFFLIALMVFCCKTSEIPKSNLSVEDKISLTTNCPDDGTCTFEVIPNSSMKILTDDTGALYPQFYKSEAVVLKFEYKKNEQVNTADGGYSELIYLEINEDDLELELENSKLEQVKLLFGRLCFCRGSSGYFKITDGSLSIKKIGNDTYRIDITFTTNKVPQIINSISETFSLK
ncbi:MAG: hypothetical protein KDD03_07280 [Gelidibacter sp.]|nr:hypothetical protein [Gelidibacter sp.]